MGSMRSIVGARSRARRASRARMRKTWEFKKHELSTRSRRMRSRAPIDRRARAIGARAWFPRDGRASASTRERRDARARVWREISRFSRRRDKKITIIHLVSPLATGEIGDASTRIAVFLLLLAKASLATEGGFDGLAPGFGVANRAREIRAPGKTNVGDAT